MEEVNNCEGNDTAEETPQPPIKTYQWEDVRRARRKGGYPWTHITKPPFEEELDVEMYTMDAYRRSRSSSTLDKVSMPDISEIEETLETTKIPIISETENEMAETTQPELKYTVENKDNLIENNSELETVKIAENPESENTIEIENNNKENLLSISNSQDIRARSEEPTKKRKLSIESSHSRISLSKLAIKDKLKHAKEKLKIPKLLKRSKSDVQETKKPKKTLKTDTRKLNQGVSEPVYIHIPLKPPPGETDEYSKYEFESPDADSPSASLSNLKHFGSGKRKLSLLGLLTELKQIYDEQVLASESGKETPSIEATSRLAQRDKSSSKSLPEILTTEDLVESNKKHKRKRKFKKSADKSGQEIKELLEASPDAYPGGSNISQYIDKDDKYEIITTEIPNLDVDCVIITDYDEPATNDSTHSNLNELPEWIDVPTEIEQPSKIRAKSEEPKRKRKSSVDSSYSRKSLSKLAFLKKFKDAKDAIKLPKFLSFTKLDSKLAKTDSAVKKESVENTSKVKETYRKKPESPLYIHIPLKVPKDKNEFPDASSNNNEIKQKEGNQETPECETPISPASTENGVQLIFLTPPSDDEILDASIPETPSESDQKFFETLKVDELKCIAKRAVDVVYPDYKHLEVVLENDKHEEDPESGVETEGGTTFWQMHPVFVDVEDGLKLSDAAIAMINEEMAKEIDRTQEISESDSKSDSNSLIKKRVSFKRSRAEDGERIYEDVGLSTETPSQSKPAPSDRSQSTSAEEEKHYLDEKVIKTTSLEEDYNKWSKITDHEYEPVNPPPEEMKLPDLIEPKASLTLKHSDEQPKHITFSEDIPTNIDAESLNELPSQHIQDQKEDQFFTASRETPMSDYNEIDITKEQNNTDQTQPIKTENKKKDKHTQKHSTTNNFNLAIKTQADKIKNKLQNIKKPNITLPHAPKFPTANFSKLKVKKPAFTIPKLPDMPSIKLASLSLTRKDASKNSWRNRQYSTESNAGDSKTKKFNFRTYPRIFEKSKVLKQRSLDDSFDTTTPSPVFATVPRVSRANSKKVPEIMNVESEEDDEPKEYYYDKSRGLVTIPIDLDSDNALHLPSHIRYNQDINIDDGFNDETEDAEVTQLPPILKIHREWIDEGTNKNYLNADHNGGTVELQSDQSSASLSDHRHGVIEEIDSDQFFLREKGISQDDIDVGKYLSSEIKEAFRNPINALTQLQSEDREYDVDVTDRSESSEEAPKRKWLKKPKRKKTPHVSNEQISIDLASDPEEYIIKHKPEPVVPTPTRPKRRSKKHKKKKLQLEDVIPYQETIAFDQELCTEPLDYIDDNELVECKPTNYIEPSNTYENDLGSNKLHYINDRDEPPCKPIQYNEGSDRYNTDWGENDPVLTTICSVYMNSQDDQFENHPMYINALEKFGETSDVRPVPPVRKNKSMKSLNYAEEDTSLNQNFEVKDSTEEFSKTLPPGRPIRKRSHTRSVSVASLREPEPPGLDTQPVRPFRFRSSTRSKSTTSIQDNGTIPSTPIPPIRANRMRSQTRSQSTESLHTSGDRDSLLDNSAEIPCVEEPCIQVMCDRMGYAIVDKTKIREPPLPPSRFPKTPPRTRRKKLPPTQDKFATVPRPPNRPIRNYSTLSKQTSTASVNRFDDDKENEEVNPYIEIDEDEIARRLQSGEVIQKMRERPLPAPPRPPRKARTPTREVFKDITHERNLRNDNIDDSKYSIKTELTDAQLLELEQQILTDDHEETITHAALVIQPITDSTIVSHSNFFNLPRDSSASPSVERNIFIEREDTLIDPNEEFENVDIVESVPVDEFDKKQTSDSTEAQFPINIVHAIQVEEDSDDEISEVPEEFHKLKSPETETLNVQESDKAPVTEVTEMNSVISEINLPQPVTQEIFNPVQTLSQEEQNSIIKGNNIALDEYHNTTDIILEDEPPPVPPRSDSVGNLVDVIVKEVVTTSKNKELPDRDNSPQRQDQNSISNELQTMVEAVISIEPPVRPPRRSSQPERHTKDEHVDLGNIKSEEEIEHDAREHSVQEHRSRESSVPITETDYTHKENVDEDSYRVTQLSDHDAEVGLSQPPLNFYNLASPSTNESDENNIPLAQCRTCSNRFRTLSRSSSSEEIFTKRYRHRRLSEPSIPQLTGQLVQSCATEFDRSLRNLISYLTDSVFHNAESKQDLQVLLLMLVVLIASLILISGDGKVEHHHHWDYFNPPKEF